MNLLDHINVCLHKVSIGTPHYNLHDFNLGNVFAMLMQTTKSDDQHLFDGFWLLDGSTECCDPSVTPAQH